MRARGVPDWLVNAAAATAALAAVTVIAVQLGREGARRRRSRRRYASPASSVSPWDDAPHPPPPMRPPRRPIRPDPLSRAADPLDDLLSAYELRKQEETRQLVQRAERIEQNRRAGAEILRRHAVEAARNAAERLEQAGHRVVLQELLQHYPPRIRLHVWPKAGPLDGAEGGRSTLELCWSEPHEGRLCARWWSAEQPDSVVEHASALSWEVDSLWVREQLMDFLRAVLT